MIQFLNMIKEVGLFWTVTLRLYIKGHTKMTVNANLTALRCCTWSKMYSILRSDVEFLIQARMLNLFKCSMKTSLTWNNYLMIPTTNLMAWVMWTMMSSRWKRIQETLVIIKSSMSRQSQNIIIRRKMPTAMYKVRE